MRNNITTQVRKKLDAELAASKQRAEKAEADLASAQTDRKELGQLLLKMKEKMENAAKEAAGRVAAAEKGTAAAEARAKALREQHTAALAAERSSSTAGRACP